MSAPVVRIQSEGLPAPGADVLLAFAASMTLAYCARPEVFPAFRRIAVEACGDDEAFAEAMRTLTPEVLRDLVDSFMRGAGG